jgi:asparagine synthase (glutamine-hydrolysing)
MSESFAARPYFNQPAVAEAFEGFIQNSNDTNTLLFWRLLNVELWLREFIDPKVEIKPVVEKSDLEPNPDKKLEITAGGGEYDRYPLRTGLVASGDNVIALIIGRLQKFFGEALKDREELADGRDWYLLVSEKIVAISQGRSYFIWDIKPGWWARFLSRRVSRTPYGIGLGSPATMHLAIREVGLPRILFASIAGATAKLFGRRGLFYQLVGSDIRAIDGPTEYSVYPSNVSAKLPPKDPDKVAAQLSEVIRATLPSKWARHYKGCVIIDANDIGRNVLGQDTGESDKLFEDIFADNPLGQAAEQTPLAVVFKQ